MTKSELKEIVQKATEEVWYNRRSLNPVEEQTELITEKLYEALILPVVVRSDKVCSHKGDKVKMNYLKFVEFAENETANGRFQKQCPNCQKYYFPSEY